MNTPIAPARRGTPWRRVPAVCPPCLPPGATVIGSLSLVATAVRHPDAHLTVPHDTPRPSKLPPTHAAPAADPPATPAE